MKCVLCEEAGGRLVFEDHQLRVVEVEDAELPASLRVIWKHHVQELTDLSPAERSACMQAVCRVEHELRQRFAPDKINLASFGNLVPHLHWHIMGRWKTDPWWPQPTWAARRPLARIPVTPHAEGLVGDWKTLRPLAAPIRYAVFVEEQGVPESEEWDDADSYCRHVVIQDLQDPNPETRGLATGRLLPDGRIGRMAVRASHRACGLGSWVLQALLREGLTLGMDHFLLHAQVHALGFYERHGFQSEGPEFMECEMPHRQMRRGADGPQ